MLKWLQELFLKPVPLVVALPEKPHYWTEDEEAIKSLASHPGFVALTYRFAAQAAVLDAKLRQNVHTSLREVDRLQLGQFWLNYLRSEVDRLVFKKATPKSATLPPSEAEQFKQIMSLIETV